MLRLPLSLLSPPGVRGRLSILIFHRVLPQPDPLFPDLPAVEDFERQMSWVKRWFNVLPLLPAIERLYAGTLPSAALAITFDDGYADNEELAAPILKRLGLSATFFVSTGFLGGGCMWNDRVIEAVRRCRSDQLDLRALCLGQYELTTISARRATIDAVLRAIKHDGPGRRLDKAHAIERAAGGFPAPALMMQEQQVRSLRAMGMDVGAHTVTHPILTRISSDAAHGEMLDSKRTLERILGVPVPLFAYPNGVPDQDYAAAHATMAQESGFAAAVSTAWGAASRHSHRFQLPRFTPWDRSQVRYGVRMLANMLKAERLAA